MIFVYFSNKELSYTTHLAFGKIMFKLSKKIFNLNYIFNDNFNLSSFTNRTPQQFIVKQFGMLNFTK